MRQDIFRLLLSSMTTNKNKSIKRKLLDYNVESWVVTTAKKKPAMNPRAIVYCRVSDAKQVTDGFGLEWQERVCRQRCATQEPTIEVAEVFLEPGVSW